MYWCENHQTDIVNCNDKHQPVAQMSFGDFETIMSIIEKATEKDLRDITEMMTARVAKMEQIKAKREATGNA